MGSFAIKPYIQAAAWIIAAVLVFLNLKMLVNEATQVFEGDAIFPKILIALIGLLFIALLVYITFLPLFTKKEKTSSIKIHGDTKPAINIDYTCIQSNCYCT